MSRSAADVPPCYATVHPGVEEIAADEIVRDLHGEVERTDRGTVVFRATDVTPRPATVGPDTGTEYYEADDRRRYCYVPGRPYRERTDRAGRSG